MAKCKRCGKKGLFLKVNYEGLCPECEEAVKKERIEKERERKEQARQMALERLNSIPEREIELSSEKRKRVSGLMSAIETSNITPKGKYDQFVVFDTETTGLKPTSERIIELAAIRFSNGKPVERFRTLINPERPIPPDATAVNNITDEMVADAPTISQVLPAFETFIGKDILVAHNLKFDFEFLYRSGCHLFETKRKYIDTLEQAKKILKKPKRKYDREYDCWDIDYDSDYDVDDYQLETLCSFYGISLVDSHRADFDALATGDLFLNLVYEKQG